MSHHMNHRTFGLTISVQVANPARLTDQELQEMAYRLLADGVRDKVVRDRADVGLVAVITPYQAIS
jgi:hypothetical protein